MFTYHWLWRKKKNMRHNWAQGHCIPTSSCKFLLNKCWSSIKHHAQLVSTYKKDKVAEHYILISQPSNVEWRPQYLWQTHAVLRMNQIKKIRFLWSRWMFPDFWTWCVYFFFSSFENKLSQTVIGGCKGKKKSRGSWGKSSSSGVRV